MTNIAEMVKRLREYANHAFDGLRAVPGSALREAADLLEAEHARAEAASDLAWFWRIVDEHGLRSVPSDEANALARICRQADRAEATIITLQSQITRLEEAHNFVRLRLRGAIGAIESNQVVDKDVIGTLTLTINHIDVVLSEPSPSNSDDTP